MRSLSIRCWKMTKVRKGMFEEFQKEDHHHAVEFGEHDVNEFDDVGIPFFLKVIYVILPIWGIFWLYTYWEGSGGWLDRGYWKELEGAAKTRNERIVSSSGSKVLK